MSKYFCLACNHLVEEKDITAHKNTHPFFNSYGSMWPLEHETVPVELNQVKTYSSSVLADTLGVSHVYIRNEGEQVSGSMKDYLVARGVNLGFKQGYRRFTVVSSGNQAYSLAKYTANLGVEAILFMPATSSKIPLLTRYPHIIVVGIKDAIFEDVYNLCANLTLPETYNINVNNEQLLAGFYPVACDISQLDPLPHFILAGVGNGSYLAGTYWGFEQLGLSSPRIIPVGMRGAFPTEVALAEGLDVYEYNDFVFGEEEISAAEGSIATASYSMPQLLFAVRRSRGFPLGNLTNKDLRNTYLLLSEDKSLIEQSVIPEPTGIMGLAAAIKHKNVFKSSDTILISFTGHGIKDPEGIKMLVPEIADYLLEMAHESRPDLVATQSQTINGRVILIDKDVQQTELIQLLATELKVRV